YEPVLSLLIERWYGNITDENYKEGMLLLVEKILFFQPIRRIMVYPNLNFLISPDLQKWMIDNVFEPTNVNKVEKIAFFIPDNLLEKVMIEFLAVMRIMEDTRKDAYQLKYFDDEDEAYRWLLE
ncbi:MAG: STAS/SEC14 domain-containing protein, partial [Cytophagia bacterium]